MTRHANTGHSEGRTRAATAHATTRGSRLPAYLLAGGIGVLLAACATAPEPEPEPAPAPVVVAPAPPPAPVVVAPPPPVAPPVPRDPYGTILAGVVDLPRAAETAAIDGCRKVHKGLTISGGFLFFTCEKLRPGVPIERQMEVARDYAQALELRGWEKTYNADKKQDEFIQYDGFGCKMTVSIRPWTDRAMNEKRRPRTDREGFRQIVFMTKFDKGQACEPTYQAFRAGTLLN